MHWVLYDRNPLYNEPDLSGQLAAVGNEPVAGRIITMLKPDGTHLENLIYQPGNKGYPSRFQWMYQEDYQKEFTTRVVDYLIYREPILSEKDASKS